MLFISIYKNYVLGCPANYFSCDDLKCHPMKDRCDSVIDCLDKTDEDQCGEFYSLSFALSQPCLAANINTHIHVCIVHSVSYCICCCTLFYR